MSGLIQYITECCSLGLMFSTIKHWNRPCEVIPFSRWVCSKWSYELSVLYAKMAFSQIGFRSFCFRILFRNPLGWDIDNLRFEFVLVWIWEVQGISPSINRICSLIKCRQWTSSSTIGPHFQAGYKNVLINYLREHLHKKCDIYENLASLEKTFIAYVVSCCFWICVNLLLRELLNMNLDW